MKKIKLKHIGILVLLLVLALLYFNINPSEVNFLPKCPLFITTGIYCPGCGSQRATHHLLNLNFAGVFQQNILYIIGLLVLGYHLIISGLNFAFKKNLHNYLYHPKTPVILLIIIFIFWILRNLPYYPFYILAPN